VQYPDDDQEGVMDNLLEALKNGSAFNVNRDRKDPRKRQPRAAGGNFLNDIFVVDRVTFIFVMVK
jgi:hypothetical protein